MFIQRGFLALASHRNKTTAQNFIILVSVQKQYYIGFVIHDNLLLLFMFSLINTHCKSRYPDFSVPVSIWEGMTFDIINFSQFYNSKF